MGSNSGEYLRTDVIDAISAASTGQIGPKEAATLAFVLAEDIAVDRGGRVVYKNKPVRPDCGAWVARLGLYVPKAYDAEPAGDFIPLDVGRRRRDLPKDRYLVSAEPRRGVALAGLDSALVFGYDGRAISFMTDIQPTADGVAALPTISHPRFWDYRAVGPASQETLRRAFDAVGPAWGELGLDGHPLDSNVEGPADPKTHLTNLRLAGGIAIAATSPR